jgi:hypothetical protein
MADKKPATTIKFFPLSAAIWRNETKDGKAFYSVTFERSYKDGDNWKSSDSFNGSDLLLLAKLADQAHTEVEKLRANDKAAQEA